MFFPTVVSEEILEVVSSNVSIEQLEMDRGFQERKGFGSVKAAIEFYGERIPEGNSRLKKSQTNSSEKPSSRIAELHEARRDTGRYSENKRLADTVKSQAESELSFAKKTVKELSLGIEESNARGKAQIKDLEKLNKTTKGEENWERTLRDSKNHQYTKLMNELENAKQELSRLKLGMASLLEDKTRAEKEREASKLKAQSYSDTAEALTNEIEKLNEEHVLVELARLEATKEREAIEAQREEAAKQHSAILDETRKKINDMIQDIDRVKELESRLAATTSDANVLESELRQVREMDSRIQRNENLKIIESNFQQDEQSDSSAFLQSTEELEAAKQELNSIKAECFQSMASMDIIRVELTSVMEETARWKKREAKTDLTIQNLNSKLLRAKAKLEATCAAEEKAESIVSNLSLTLEQVKTEAEAAKKERILHIEETTILKAEVQKTESEIDVAEERFQAALQELKTVKSSEAKALESLKMLTEKTMRNRALASQRSSTITISTFEYEYLTGCAVRAAEIADKKVAAAQAWVDALKASEKEMLMKMELPQSGNKQEVVRTEQSTSSKRMVERELEKWRQRFEKVSEREIFQPQQGQSRKSMTVSMKFTPAGRAKFRMSASPAARHSPRSTSFSVNRRRKVMPNLAKFFSGKSIEGNL